MCLAIPMKIDSIHNHTAYCSSRGILREINIFMFQKGELKAGDYVMVHVGYAIQKVTPEAAHLAIETDQAMHSAGKGTTHA